MKYIHKELIKAVKEKPSAAAAAFIKIARQVVLIHYIENYSFIKVRNCNRTKVIIQVLFLSNLSILTEMYLMCLNNNHKFNTSLKNKIRIVRSRLLVRIPQLYFVKCVAKLSQEMSMQSIAAIVGKHHHKNKHKNN